MNYTYYLAITLLLVPLLIHSMEPQPTPDQEIMKLEYKTAKKIILEQMLKDQYGSRFIFHQCSSVLPTLEIELFQGVPEEPEELPQEQEMMITNKLLKKILKTGLISDSDLLLWALKLGFEESAREIITYAINNHGDMNKLLNTECVNYFPLHTAVDNPVISCGMVKKLIDLGAHVNKENIYGSPLRSLYLNIMSLEQKIKNYERKSKERETSQKDIAKLKQAKNNDKILRKKIAYLSSVGGRYIWVGKDCTANHFASTSDVHNYLEAGPQIPVVKDLIKSNDSYFKFLISDLIHPLCEYMMQEELPK